MSSDGEARTAFQEWLGFESEYRDDGVVEAKLPYDEKLSNPFGVINGSIVTALVDLGSGAALRAAMGGDGQLATVDLNVRFLAPAMADLRAEVRPIKASGSIGVTRADVTQYPEDGEPELVAVGSTAYRLFGE